MNKAANPNTDERILEVKGLQTSFYTRAGAIRAVTGVDFHVNKGEVLGIVGESGCGKSVTSLSILGLVGEPGVVEAGEVLFGGRDLLTLSDDEMRKIRGDRIAMIFQQPQSSLNPVMKVGSQISESLEIHTDLKGKAVRERTLELMDMVGIPDAKARYEAYPHEMSGGMAQRVMIAIALSCEPELLIADEPTTALDVTIQAQILDLMRTLQERTGTAIVLITHDLGVVAEMCDRAAVMYAGEVVEQTDVRTLFNDPKHPYTQGLIGAVPVPGEILESLATIPGSVPNLIELPEGCRFAPRCSAREAHGNVLAERAHPELLASGDHHLVRCWLYHHEDGSPRSDPDTWPEAGR
jgi:oligopeptide/dipeptide ABC transporter ATP-binding protein